MSTPENCPRASRVSLASFPFGDWTIHTSKSHILTKHQEEEYTGELDLPHLPDMLFSRNGVSIMHSKGYGVSFRPLEALKCVNNHEDLVHVAKSKEWLEARSEHAHINKIAKPYDWTFTPTNYRGTFEEGGGGFNVCETSDKINYEKLKEKEKILFFEEVILYEDELDDNGCSKLSVKIRVMPSGFFCLQRFYLRVDNTLIRTIDTRIYHEVENNYILREYSVRESKFDDLNVPPMLLTDQNEIVQHLSLKEEVTEKLVCS